MIPESIKQHKPDGCEIRHKNGHYYVYKVKGFYDRTTHKSKSKSLGCVGQIYEGLGFVPNKKDKSASVLKTKEYGATKTIMTAGANLFDTLRKCFPSDFIRIYVLSVLKLLGNLASKDIDTAYAKSAISMLLPEVDLSKNTVSTFLSSLSLERDGMLEFMKSYIDYKKGGLIFDATSFISNSKSNPFCEKGYAPSNKEKQQIRLFYAFDKIDHEPAYFKIVPRNISDKAAFEACIDEIGLKGFTIILDKDFYSDKNIQLMKNNEFIMPLQGNTSLVPNQIKQFSGYNQVITNNFTYHNRMVYFTEIEVQKHNDCKVCIFYDSERRQYLVDSYFKKFMEKDGSLPPEIKKSAADDTASFGVTMLLTNMKSIPKNIYMDYKSRWEIEEMFDTHKHTLSFNMNYETSCPSQEGWAFIEFLALLLYHKLNRMLINSGLIKSVSVKELLYKASTITQCNENGVWKICNMTKPLADVFQSLGVAMESII
ncbi:MAG: transposase [Christensenellaceae bacterium]|jgi:transposase|nr:transposase [Christensenellaceae bacterium]